MDTLPIKRLVSEETAYRVQNSTQSYLRDLSSVGVTDYVVMTSISFLRILPSRSWEGLLYAITIVLLHSDI
jgi:hypothetical protein